MDLLFLNFIARMNRRRHQAEKKHFSCFYVDSQEGKAKNANA